MDAMQVSRWGHQCSLHPRRLCGVAARRDRIMQERCGPAHVHSVSPPPCHLTPHFSAAPLPPPHRRRPTTQLRWVAPDGRLMVRCEGPEAAQAERGAGPTRQALSGAKGTAEQWLKDLINLAALY